jgi:murein DD-endopeptidase MepM/ murein hydrolase activator NlpD
MGRGFVAGACFTFLLLAHSFAQQIEIARDNPAGLVAPPALSGVDEEVKERASEALPNAVHYERGAAPQLTPEQMRKAGALARQKIDKETRLQAARATQAAKRFVEASQPVQDGQSRSSPPALLHGLNLRNETALIRLANGFDFPVGKPDAQGYYKARGFHSHGHLGEDWDGIRGGDTDLGAPIYSIGNGVVVFARDCHMGWGNVVIIRHAFRENGTVTNIDSLYGHLNTILVRRGQAVSRGDNIGTMGTAHGIYDAHLHFEVRKNLEIGMSRAAFARDSSNYYDPTQFILAHRQLPTAKGTYRIALNTFTRDANIRWDERRNYSHASSPGTSESAAALQRALASEH